MKSLEEYVTEAEGQQIDQEWLDNEKAVMTRDKRQAIILDIDISKVPNVIKGQVKKGEKLCDYEWDDTGHCTQATDEHGVPIKPDENDDLVKAS